MRLLAVSASPMFSARKRSNCTTIDGGGGQERHRLSARCARFLLQRAQISDGGFGDACELSLLLGGGVELDGHMFGHG